MNSEVSIPESMNETVKFVDIDHMCQLSESNGWTIEYDQLQKGSLAATATTWECGRVSLMDESSDRAMHVRGTPPPDTVTVLLALNNSRLWANGRWIHDRSMIVYKHGDEVNAVTDSDRYSRVLSMHIPADLMQPALNSFGIEDLEILGLSANPMACTRGAISRLRYAMLKSRPSDSSSGSLDQNESMLVKGLAELIAGTNGGGANPLAVKTRKKFEVLNRVDQFLDANTQQRFQVADLAKAAFVSERTLVRVLRSEFDVTPSEYILSYRLNQARRRLIGPVSAGDSIAQIAMDSGFSHFSRFSGSFREHFGMSPKSYQLKSSHITT